MVLDHFDKVALNQLPAIYSVQIVPAASELSCAARLQAQREPRCDRRKSENVLWQGECNAAMASAAVLGQGNDSVLGRCREASLRSRPLTGRPARL